MTILLTGGTGFMGAWIVRALVGKKYKPIIYDLRSDLSLLEDAKGKFELVQGDTLDLATLIQTIKRFKITRIIHAAALTSPPNPLTGVKINVEGSINVFEAARLPESLLCFGYLSGQEVFRIFTGISP